MNVERCFSSSYTFNASQRRIDAKLPSFVYPGAIEDGWVDGVFVEVTPASGDPWLGSFSFGEISPNAATIVCTHPDPDRICVVARGDGYVVRATDPRDWEEMDLTPIMGLIAVRQQSSLIAYTFDRIAAVGAKGILWKTPAISWDGITNVSIDGAFVKADIWDSPANAVGRVEVDMATGDFNGGASPELL